MYLINVIAQDSSIQGKGLFAEQEINKGEIVWKFVEGHDKSLTLNEYSALSEEDKKYMDKVAYLSSISNQYIFPPDNDPALYTNHDAQNHNLSAVVDHTISPEPFFIANRDIMAGEELTNNYHEFDEAIKSKAIVPDWLK